jgi:hypothetical protein
MIKKGDIVICINDGPYARIGSESYLTKNKQYRVIDIGSDFINVINDNIKRNCSYNLDRFISIAEWREQQIKSVLDD